MRVVFLILSSHDLPIYSTMREISRLYFKKMKQEYDFHHFFVEFREMNTDIEIENDTIYVNGIERIEFAINKTHRAMQLINQLFEYDIIIRTNLSSFWNIPVLYNYLESLESTNIAIGHRPFQSFISGTSIIMSRDICTKLCEYNLNGAPDDVVISQYLSQFVILRSMPEHTFIYLVEGANNKIPDDTSNAVVFRVRCDLENRIHDGLTFKILAKKIYDIDIDLTILS